jgi:hypothetical protein
MSTSRELVFRNPVIEVQLAQSFHQPSVISHQLGKEDKYTSSLQAFYVTVHIQEETWFTICWLCSLVKTKITLPQKPQLSKPM